MNAAEKDKRRRAADTEQSDREYIASQQRQWELRHVEDTDAAMDDSGVYVVVHRVEHTARHKEYSGVRVTVRADLMCIGPDGITSEPIMSFSGSANAVRKALVRFLDNYLLPRRYTPINHEHATYIGYELLRAELTPGYVQD